jgi:hypothetical protein
MLAILLNASNNSNSKTKGLHALILNGGGRDKVLFDHETICAITFVLAV